MTTIKRVVVGISGGVDSAVSAFLLKLRGYNVVGAFMKNWDITDEIGTCSISKDQEDAEWVCHTLGIQFHEVNFVKEYWHDVFSYLIHDYISGYTPNPDIICNKKIKFCAFLNYALENLHADAIATGHYARTSFGDYLEEYFPKRGVRLLKPVDLFKDQTFFLSQVKQEALQRTMFPLGNLTKKLVKRIAEETELFKVVKRKESMGICFIGRRNFQNFISQYVDNQNGHFIDIETGCIVGNHSGIHNWTIGQRCQIGGLKKPYFVAKKDVSTQTIYVAGGSNHSSLFTYTFVAGNVHWIHSVPIALKETGIFTCEFRFQHTKPLCKCTLSHLSDDSILVRINIALRAITPGQYAVFYKGQECLGSARIYDTGPSLYTLNEGVTKEGLIYS